VKPLSSWILLPMARRSILFSRQSLWQSQREARADSTTPYSSSQLDDREVLRSAERKVPRPSFWQNGRALICKAGTAIHCPAASPPCSTCSGVAHSCHLQASPYTDSSFCSAGEICYGQNYIGYQTPGANINWNVQIFCSNSPYPSVTVTPSETITCQ
jgi:hypothetical protein